MADWKQFQYTHGDIDTSFSIMREAAQWLIDTSKPMWSLEELTTQYIQNPPEDFVVMWAGHERIATLLLSFEDKLFWPDIDSGTSGFIYKLTIRRKFANQGYARYLIEYAAQLCRLKNIACLRLDCDPHRKGLCQFYENTGFVLKEIKRITTPRLGQIDIALYEMHLE